MGRTHCSVASLIVYFIIAVCDGQLHYLKFINSNASTTNSPPQFDSSLFKNYTSNIGNTLSKADRICVSGMWALYNTTDFGEGAEDTTTVVSVRGTSINTCTKSGQVPVLKSVQSVLYLGNADYSKNGLLIFSQPYLLGGLWNVTVFENDTVFQLPPEISGFPLGSIAITGTMRHWLICGDRNSPCSSGVCVNMNNYESLFIQRNVSKDNSVANGWPKIVRKVQIVDSNVCSNYPSPKPINPRKIF